MTDLLLLSALASALQVQLEVLSRIEASGRLMNLVRDPAERIAPPPQIAPGSPPLLAFRFFEGQDRHRFGKLDLILDDAGH